jgi:hypothetical protein
MRETKTSPGPAVTALLLLVAPAVLAAPRVPARLLAARYVALGFDLGDRGFVSATEAMGLPDRVTPEDRKALEAVREAIESWDRYAIEIRPANAEILIALRVGRRTLGKARIGDPAGSGSSERSGGIELSSLSSRDDMLSVYDAGSGGVAAALLWRAQRVDGLSGSSPALLEQLKADVEASARKP